MNDETLMLFYYEDGLMDAERRDIETALQSDVSVRSRYEALCRELDAIGTTDTPVAPPHVVARLHDAIDQAAMHESARTRPWREFNVRSFIWGMAVAASLAVGLAIGVFVDREVDTVTVPIDPMARTATAPSAAFTRGLLVHFQESRDRLTKLAPDGNGERSELIMHIVHQNRLFERAASQHGSDDLARVLRAFEQVLVRLADR